MKNAKNRKHQEILVTRCQTKPNIYLMYEVLVTGGPFQYRSLKTVEYSRQFALDHLKDARFIVVDFGDTQQRHTIPKRWFISEEPANNRIFNRFGSFKRLGLHEKKESPDVPDVRNGAYVGHMRGYGMNQSREFYRYTRSFALNHKKNLVGFSIFVNGKKIKEIPIREVLKRIESREKPYGWLEDKRALEDAFSTWSDFEYCLRRFGCVTPALVERISLERAHYVSAPIGSFFAKHSQCYLNEARAILEGKHWQGKNKCVALPDD